MKHTPGPWSLDISKSVFEKSYLNLPDSQQLVIDPNYFSEANANLIAAAPEMLEALEWIMPKIHQAHHDGEFEACHKSTCVEARKAIAKAKGESK